MPGGSSDPVASCLRICLSRGKVGCCDDSPNRHATAHAQESTHPLIRSLEPGEEWSWCYVDDIHVDDRTTSTGKHASRPLRWEAGPPRAGYCL